MSRLAITAEMELIERIILEHSKGIGISALQKVLADDLPNLRRRTLQRRLKRLQESGRIITEGESISLIYKPASMVVTPQSGGHKQISDNRLDTQNLIEFGLAAEGKDILETQMILNHKAAIEMLIEAVDQVGFNSFSFFNLHALLAENLLVKPLKQQKVISEKPYEPSIPSLSLVPKSRVPARPFA